MQCRCRIQFKAVCGDRIDEKFFREVDQKRMTPSVIFSIFLIERTAEHQHLTARRMTDVVEKFRQILNMFGSKN